MENVTFTHKTLFFICEKHFNVAFNMAKLFFKKVGFENLCCWKVLSRIRLYSIAELCT